MANLRKLSLLLLCWLHPFVVFTDAGAAPRKGSTLNCRFGGSEYAVGHTWHPRLESQGTVFCVTCHCHEGGRMNCTSRECPVSCVTDDVSECCRICAEATAPSRPAAHDVVACIHNGRIYKDGQSFPSNATGIKVSGPNQCVQCKCQEGMVVCEVQTCRQVSCHEPTHSPENCCPQCPVAAGRSSQASSVAFKEPTAPRERRDKDCVSAGKYYVDGSSWHPVVGPFGPMDCVLCQCRAGTIECHRFRCPGRGELSCPRPVKEFGQCCPVCPAAAVKADGVEPGTPRCVPKDSELLVYRAQGAGNLSEFIQYAFQQPRTPAAEVELHSWVTRRGALETFQIQRVAGSDFAQLRHKFRFLVLGATTSKHVTKFTRRERKLRKRCLVTCGSKVQRLEDTFNLVKAVQRKSCLSSELQLAAL